MGEYRKEIGNLTERKDKYKTDLEKAQRQIDSMIRDRDRDRLNLEDPKAKFQSSQELVIEKNTAGQEGVGYCISNFVGNICHYNYL